MGKSNYDIPSESIYLKRRRNKKVWSLGLNPMPDNKEYDVIYGFGYAKYIHKSDGIEQILEVYVPKRRQCKSSNTTFKKILRQIRKKIKIYCYNKPVLGEDEKNNRIYRFKI